jgi:hypothetical protein
MREGDIIAKQFWGDIIANLLQENPEWLTGAVISEKNRIE